MRTKIFVVAEDIRPRKKTNNFVKRTKGGVNMVLTNMMSLFNKDELTIMQNMDVT